MWKEKVDGLKQQINLPHKKECNLISKIDFVSYEMSAIFGHALHRRLWHYYRL